MNNIYVDELPKSCENCPFYKLDTYIDINYVTRTSHECVLEGSILTGDCPLKPLSVALAEEQKMLVQEFKKMMPIFFGKSEFDWEGFNDYLDQIEKCEN